MENKAFRGLAALSSSHTVRTHCVGGHACHPPHPRRRAFTPALPSSPVHSSPASRARDSLHDSEGPGSRPKYSFPKSGTEHPLRGFNIAAPPSWERQTSGVEFRASGRGSPVALVAGAPWTRDGPVGRLCFSQEVRAAPRVSVCISLYGLSPSVVMGLC